MGGGSSETPKLYYVIYEHPLIVILLFQVKSTCPYRKIESHGDLMYCYDRGKKMFQGLEAFDLFRNNYMLLPQPHLCQGLDGWILVEFTYEQSELIL